MNTSLAAYNVLANSNVLMHRKNSFVQKEQQMRLGLEQLVNLYVDPNWFKDVLNICLNMFKYTIK